MITLSSCIQYISSTAIILKYSTAVIICFSAYNTSEAQSQAHQETEISNCVKHHMSEIYSLKMKLTL